MLDHEHMETLATIEETIAAIMTNSFAGVLVGPDGVEYRDFSRLGVLPRDLYDGQRVNRIKNPDMRIAHRIRDGHRWFGGLAGFTPDKLRSMFATGMVVKGSEAHYRRLLLEADQPKTPELIAKRGDAVEMMQSMLREANDDRRGLLETAFSRMYVLAEPDRALRNMHELRAMDDDELSSVVLGYDRAPSL